MSDPGFFGRAKEKFENFKSPTAISILNFPPIDAEKTAAALGVEEKAKTNGASNLPPPDSVSLDAVEQAIVDEVDGFVKQYYQDYLLQARTYASRMMDANAPGGINSIETIATSAVADFAVAARSAQSELHVWRDRAIEMSAGLENFKARHDLERPPMRYDQSRILTYGILAIIAVMETGFNAMFLSKGSTMGLLGGALEASMISMINLALGGFAGRLVLPYMGYRSWIRCPVAWILFFAYLAFIIAFNLVVAHYRDAVAIDPFEGTNVAIKSFWASPFAIADIKSWGMVVIGLVFSTIAVIDFYMMDDPYPGYGDAYREWLSAADTYNEVYDEEVQLLRDKSEDTHREISDVLRQIQMGQSNLVNIVASATALKAGMADYIQGAARTANLLLKVYRDANMRARTTPPPSRFLSDSRYELGKVDLEAFGSVKVDPIEISARIEAAATTHRKCVNDLTAAYSEAQASLDALGRITIPKDARRKAVPAGTAEKEAAL